MEHIKKRIKTTGIIFGIFILFTLALKTIDVKPIGPNGSEVGFAALNKLIFDGLGVHPVLHTLTGCIGAIAIAIAMSIIALAAAQWIIRKDWHKVDREILMLCVFYVLVLAFYLLFEKVVINCRPILEDGVLEASYPSSHTMLVCCIMATILPVLNRIFYDKPNTILICRISAAALIVVTVLGRLISGVHWFTDILGAVILSASLVLLFYTALEYIEYRCCNKR